MREALAYRRREMHATSCSYTARVGVMIVRLPSGKRPDSSVVEHFHGKEGVVSSILTWGTAFAW